MEGEGSGCGGGVEITLTIPLVGAVFAVHFLVTAPVLWDAVTITSAHEVANRALMVCKCNQTRKHNWLLSEISFSVTSHVRRTLRDDFTANL